MWNRSALGRAAMLITISGLPGSGKTTVARLVAQALRPGARLRRGHLPAPGRGARALAAGVRPACRDRPVDRPRPRRADAAAGRARERRARGTTVGVHGGPRRRARVQGVPGRVGSRARRAHRRPRGRRHRRPAARDPGPRGVGPASIPRALRRRLPRPQPLRCRHAHRRRRARGARATRSSGEARRRFSG